MQTAPDKIGLQAQMCAIAHSSGLSSGERIPRSSDEVEPSGENADISRG